MHWKMAAAKQHFSEVVKAAERELQIISRRDRVVAGVISGDDVEPFRAWQAERSKVPLGTLLDEMRRICEEEGIDGIETGPRIERPNAMLERRARAPARHKRRK